MAPQFGAGPYGLVGVAVGVVDVVGGLGGEPQPLDGLVGNLAHDGVVAEEERASLGRAVHEVEVEAHLAEVEAVAEGEVADELALSALDGVNRPDGAPHAVLPAPVEVVAVGVVGQVVERALRKLEREFVATLVGRERGADAPHVGLGVVPVVAAVVEADGGTIVLEAADHVDEFAGAHRELRQRPVGEVEEIGGVEEIAVERGLVEPVAHGEREVEGEVGREENVEVLALEAAGIAVGLAADVLALVVAAGLHFEVGHFELLGIGVRGCHEEQADK